MIDFRRRPRNEKLATRRRREAIIEIVCFILMAPMMYVLLVLACAL